MQTLHKNLLNIIFTLSTRPQRLIVNGGILTLGVFLMGYFYGKSDSDLLPIEKHFRQNFHQWVAKKYDCQLNHSWANILYFYEGDGLATIQKFIQLFQSFEQEFNPIKQEYNMQTQQILDFIQSRRSMGNLIAPAPSREQIKQAIATAITAPDHKNLEPWRFIVFEGDSMNQLGQALHQASIEQGQTDEKSLDKARNMPKRAPMIIACITDYKTHEKVPKSEQLLSCGACVENLLLALQALGFATVWRSGELSFAKAIKDFLGVTGNNEVVGFIYVGTAGTAFPPRKPMDVNKFIEFR